jgi:group I intron endonuclease
MYGVIYLVTNKVNGHVYVGQTTDTVLGRWKSHLKAVRSGSKNVLHCAIRKYGAENFALEEIDFAETQEELNRFEELHVARLGSNVTGVGYNCTSGGGQVVFTEEVRHKISVGRTGKGLGSPSDETRRKVSEGVKGYKHSPETKVRISEATKAIMTDAMRSHLREAAECRPPVTEETRRKLSVAAAGRLPSEETRRRMSEAARARYKKVS